MDDETIMALAALARLEEKLSQLESEIRRLKPMELMLIRLDGLIDKIALGLGISPNG